MSDVVPEFVDPPAPPALCSPRPLGWGTWIPAVVFLPFAPKRIGVRLSATSWPVAIVVIMTCAVLAVLIAGHIGSHFYDPRSGITFSLTGGNPPPPSVDLHDDPGLVSRAQNAVTSAINTIYLATASFGDVYTVLGVMLAICGLCLFLGLLALPYMATGERLGRLLGRSIKLSLFSSVVLVIGVAAVGVFVVLWLDQGRSFDQLRSGGVFEAVVLLGFFAWWFNVIVRMGRLYSGPAEGPAWQPVRPRCLGCGYILTGLPCDGDCPECGLAVGDSLGANRKSSAWAAALRLRNQPVGWLRTCRAVFRNREFFRRLDVSGGTRKAIDFAGVTSAIPAAIVAALALMAGILRIGPPATLIERIVFPAVLTFAGLAGTRFVFFAALSLIGLLVGYRRGVDPRAVTVAVCYGSVRLLPVIATAVALTVALAMFPSLLSPAASGLPFQTSFGSLMAVIPILLLVRVVFQIRRSVRDVVGVGR